MIGIKLNNMAYEQDIRELLMAFYPGETFEYQGGDLPHSSQKQADITVEGILSQDRTRFSLELSFCGSSQFYGFRNLPEDIEEEARQLEEPLSVDYDNRFETKNKIKRRLYVLLLFATGKTLPWGTLTGIRPAKIAMTRLREGQDREQIFDYMKKTYFTSDEKISLAIEIAEREKKLLELIGCEQGYSLYIGIPFCPTTCLYCSFTSYPIGKWEKKTRLYLEALFRELDYVAEAKKGCTLDTVYIGGGTPTSLSAEDLECLLRKLKDTFDFSMVREFTVEAGRPDSITREKLRVLKKYGVSRISINPQTMQQKTLDLIGRRHTVEEVKEKFIMAREEGFNNINMDLILGLPKEELKEVQDTLEAVKALGPDSLTVHSLAIKRAARLNTMKEVYKDLKITNTQEMIDLTARYARELGMEPYYLYRQKNMAGNFENVGYALLGKACIYNVLIMEEVQTIIGCGAGTTTKRLFFKENRIERVENVKDVTLYIEKIDEMIERKRRMFQSK